MLLVLKNSCLLIYFPVFVSFVNVGLAFTLTSLKYPLTAWVFSNDTLLTEQKLNVSQFCVSSGNDLAYRSPFLLCLFSQSLTLLMCCLVSADSSIQFVQLLSQLCFVLLMSFTPPTSNSDTYLSNSETSVLYLAFPFLHSILENTPRQKAGAFRAHFLFHRDRVLHCLLSTIQKGFCCVSFPVFIFCFIGQKGKFSPMNFLSLFSSFLISFTFYVYLPVTSEIYLVMMLGGKFFNVVGRLFSHVSRMYCCKMILVQETFIQPFLKEIFRRGTIVF